MKIAIVGAGAIGRLFGGMLGRGGNEVTYVEKDAELVQCLNEKGIEFKRLYDEDGDPYPSLTVSATLDAEAIDGCDLSIIAVKGYATAAAVRSIAHLITDEAPVLSIQTGLGNIETMTEIVERINILGGVTYHGATSLDGSKVHHTGTGATLIGELDGYASDRLEKIKKIFEASGMQIEISNNILGHIWAKAIVYSSINPLAAILKIKNGQLIQKMESIALAKRLIEEGKLVAQAYAVQLPSKDLYDWFLEVCKKTENNLSPMLQDILNDRPTEIESLNGAIHAIGGRKGIQTPIHQTMTDVIRLIEKYGIGGEFVA